MTENAVFALLVHLHSLCMHETSVEAKRLGSTCRFQYDHATLSPHFEGIKNAVWAPWCCFEQWITIVIISILNWLPICSFSKTFCLEWVTAWAGVYSNWAVSVLLCGWWLFLTLLLDTKRKGKLRCAAFFPFWASAADSSQNTAATQQTPGRKWVHVLNCGGGLN